MMRTMSWAGSLALIVIVIAGCSASSSGGRCENGGCSQKTQVDPLQGTDDAPTAGLGSEGFFNSPDDAVPVQPTMMSGPEPTTGEPVNSGECASGQFCAPNEPDPANCGTIRFDVDVEVTRTPGNVLLVFDRSSSMNQDWNGSARWETAGNAISSALQMLAADLSQAGAIMFPTPDPDAQPVCVDPTGIACIFAPFLMVSPGSCGVAPAGGMEHIPFQPGGQFVTTFTGNANAKPYTPVPGGFTPLKEGLIQAQAAIAGANLQGSTAVVIITDGEPNCEWDAAQATQIVSDWASQGIETHVIGLPGVGGMGPGLLNSLAQAGGTGMFITPADQMALQAKLTSIVQETVRQGFNSCSMALNPAADVPDELLMIVDEPGVGRQRVERTNGWSINANGDQVEMTGGLCEAAMAGRFASITFEYACPDVEPPPAIPVL